MDESELAQLDMSALSPGDFARLVSGTPKNELADLMSGELRGRVLDEIFQRMQGQFIPAKAPRRRTVVHWHVTGGRTPGQEDGDDTYELVIDQGKCVVNKPPTEDQARVAVTLDGVEFLKLVSGNANATTMFLTRKLKLEGDLGVGAGLTSMFDIPRP